MKKFLLKAIGFFILIFTTISLFLYGFGGYVDYFYEKFTTPKSSSLVIGDSRALQGIQPQVINSKLKDFGFSLPIQNYAFTIAQSRIGNSYTTSILKKLDTTNRNGLFIISINPWMLSSLKTNNNYLGEFVEKGTPPHNMNYVSLNPNFEYLIKNYNYFHFRAIFKQKSFLHKDGWLEERNLPEDSNVFNEWKENQLKIFSGFKRDYKISTYRKKELEFLINTLKKYGLVILIRTPVENEMLSLENSFYSDFSKDMQKIATILNIKYIDFNDKKIKYKTYDGHHINKFSGVRFTQNLSLEIQKYWLTIN